MKHSPEYEILEEIIDLEESEKISETEKIALVYFYLGVAPKC